MSLQKSKIIDDTFFLNIALVISQILSIIQSFFILRFLDPIKYGIWLSVMLFLNYGAYSHIGTVYGMVIKMLYYKEQKEYNKLKIIQDTGYTSWTIFTIIFCIFFFIYMLFDDSLNNFKLFSIIIIVCMLFVEQQTTFLIQWQTSYNKNFKLMGKSNMIRSILSFITIIPLAYFFNVFGVMIGTLFVYILVYIYWRVNSEFRPTISISYKALKEILIIGMPTLVVVLSGALIQNVDRLVILRMLGSVYLGYYGITALGGATVYGLLSQAGSTMGPHIVEDFAKSGDSPSVLGKYLIKPTLIFSYISTFLISNLIIFVPYFVSLFLPKYQPGINSFYLMIPGFFFLSIILTASNILSIILISKSKQHFIFYIQVTTIAIQILLSYFLIKVGYKIEGVAIASTISSAFYGLSILYLSLHYVLRDFNAIKSHILQVLFPFIYTSSCVFLFIIISKRLFTSLHYSFLFILISTFLIYIPLVIILNKKTNFISDLKPLFDNFILKFRNNSKS
jgi:O-antigen/teichoic acid export membrane protein